MISSYFGTYGNQLNGLLNTVNMVSDDIKMEFGLDKCAKATFNRGTKVSTKGIQLPDKSVIQEWAPEATYTYLGIEESDGMNWNTIKWSQDPERI